MRRAFALLTLTYFIFSFVGYLQNLDNACFRCLIASLQSSLYHELFFFGFIEVLGKHLSDMSMRDEVKSETGSVELWKFSMFKN